MSQESVGIENVVVRRWFWAFENDVDAFRDLLHPDIAWFQIEEDRSPVHGIDDAVQARSRWLDTWDEHRFDLEQVFEADDSVIVSVHITARGKASGAPVEVRFHARFKLLDGKVVYIFDHEDRASALEAVGLAESAMSQENVEIVRQFIEAARSGDVHAIEAFVAVSDPSMEHTRLPAASGPETYCGHDGARRWFTDMADLWREWRNEIEELVEVGPDTVAARMRFIAVGRESGVPVEARLGLVCVLSEGKILRSRTYASGEAALAAVGLSE